MEAAGGRGGEREIRRPGGGAGRQPPARQPVRPSIRQRPPGPRRRKGTARSAGALVGGVGRRGGADCAETRAVHRQPRQPGARGGAPARQERTRPRGRAGGNGRSGVGRRGEAAGLSRSALSVSSGGARLRLRGRRPAPHRRGRACDEPQPRELTPRTEGLPIDRRATLRQAWPREGPGAARCVRSVDDQCVLQFTLVLAASCVLHRRTSRVIHR